MRLKNAQKEALEDLLEKGALPTTCRITSRTAVHWRTARALERKGLATIEGGWITPTGMSPGALSAVGGDAYGRRAMMKWILRSLHEPSYLINVEGRLLTLCRKCGRRLTGRVDPVTDRWVFRGGNCPTENAKNRDALELQESARSDQ